MQSVTIYITIFTILVVSANVLFYTKTLQNLKKKVREQERQLDIANVKISEVRQLKSDIVSLASHQIRSPLVAISGYSSMVAEGDYGNVTGKVRTAVTHIIEASQNLMQITNEFLDISKLQENQVEYNMVDFDLKKVTKEIFNDFSSIAKEKNLDLRFKTDNKEPYKVFADKQKIQKVIFNMVDNAIKYTPKGFVEIRLKKIDGKINLDVKDSGIGIHPEEQTKLFHKFARTKAANDVYVMGTGLGLYIAKRIIMAQGGNIKAHSDGPGKGSTFTMELVAKE